MRKHNISRLHLITCDHPELKVSEIVRMACESGVRWIQLRMKDHSKDKILEVAYELRAITHAYNAALIINDHAEVALKSGADGVHLGKKDMSPSEARRILGDSMIIGGTANTLEDVMLLTKEGVDYIGAGPFRFTTTKKDLSPVLGCEGLRQLANASGVPVIAIGGIRVEDIKILDNTAIHGVAVASSIINSPYIKKTAKAFIDQLNLFKNGTTEA